MPDQVSPSRYKRPESVLVVVHTDAAALLLQRIGPPVFWQSVTGALEYGEQPQAAAIRELEEETGISGVPVRATGIVRTFDIFEAARPFYAPGVIRNREHLFYCHLESDMDIRLCEEEHLAWEWIPLPEAATRVISWTNQLAFRSLLAANQAS